MNQDFKKTVIATALAGPFFLVGLWLGSLQRGVHAQAVSPKSGSLAASGSETSASSPLCSQGLAFHR
ncbi:hypothetical protein [Solimonas aquatica]|uniref:hypothetical protein n=1 Tax=Solimonas aquatica TaxID=489703 RepID=UPI0015A6F8A0|nr:hypothetical protein [Solimonas aquatica]